MIASVHKYLVLINTPLPEQLPSPLLTYTFMHACALIKEAVISSSDEYNEFKNLMCIDGHEERYSIQHLRIAKLST